jgi:hypothetical protein
MKASSLLVGVLALLSPPAAWAQGAPQSPRPRGPAGVPAGAAQGMTPPPHVTPARPTVPGRPTRGTTSPAGGSVRAGATETERNDVPETAGGEERRSASASPTAGQTVPHDRLDPHPFPSDGRPVTVMVGGEIVISAEPPPLRATTPSRTDGLLDDDRPRLPRIPRDTPEAAAASWRRRLALGGTFGIGSPVGLIGAFLEYNPISRIGIALGGGLGGNFGPALALSGYVRPFFLGRWAPVLGVGYSMNFTPGRYFFDAMIAPAMRVPSVSHWLNFEAGVEYRSPRGLLLRGAVGHNVMLNTGQFWNVEVPGMYGPPDSSLIGFDPISAADAHDRGEAMHFMYFHVDLGYIFNL